MKKVTLTLIWLIITSITALALFPELRPRASISKADIAVCQSQLEGIWRNESLNPIDLTLVSIAHECVAGQSEFLVRFVQTCELGECPRPWVTAQPTDVVNTALTARLFDPRTGQEQAVTLQWQADDTLLVTYTTLDDRTTTETISAQFRHVSLTPPPTPDVLATFHISELLAVSIDGCSALQQFYGSIQLDGQPAQTFEAVSGLATQPNWEVQTSVPAGTRYLEASIHLFNRGNEACGRLSDTVDISPISNQAALHLRADLITKQVCLYDITGRLYSCLGNTNQSLTTTGNPNHPHANITFHLDIINDF